MVPVRRVLETTPEVSVEPSTVDAVPAPRTAEALLEGLDPEQRAVATTLAGPVAVIAGAGTGKTRAITHRIAYGVATGVFNPTSVLAVTFTTRAAGELRGRLQQLGAQGVQARTFHSAALRQAQYFWPKAYGGDLPSVLDNRMGLVAEAASRLRVRVDTPKLRDLVSEIAWAKVSNVEIDDYARIAPGHQRAVAGIEPETVARIFAGYEQAKRDRSRIDFEDILLCAAALLSDHPEIADTVRRTYRHLVVDEYQDVSPLQEALLTLWRGDRTDLCVVGDPAQTIHSFAGAQPHFLTGFARRFPGASVIKLVRDYRSTPQVVGCANAVMAPAGGAVTLQAQLPPGPEVEFAEASDESAEAAGIADWLAAQAAAGVPYREMAVLFRINAQSPPVEQALAERGIPYLVRGGERFYERPEVRQTLLTLRTEVRARGRRADAAVEQFKAVLGVLGWTPAAAGRRRCRPRAVGVAGRAAQRRRGPAARGHRPGRSADPGGDRRPNSTVGPRRSTSPPRRGSPCRRCTRPRAWSGTRWRCSACTRDRCRSSWPPRRSSRHEERRLLYVGITRARRMLRISWSRTRNGGGATRRPSRFLDPVLPDGMRTAADTGRTDQDPRRDPGRPLPLLRQAAGQRGRAQDGAAR